MKVNNQIKTNAIRLLDKENIQYTTHYYELKEAISGALLSDKLNLDPKTVFKTLVTIGRSHKNYVFMIPVLEELDLKKAATITQEKSIEMIPQKMLLPLTGYVHGGCSPLGMKKIFPTYIHKSCEMYDNISFSGGKIGLQITMNPRDLIKVIPIIIEDIIVPK